MDLLKFVPIKLTLVLVLGILLGNTIDFGIQLTSILTLVFLSILGIIFFKQTEKDTPYFGIIVVMATISLGMLSVALAQPKNAKNHYSHQKISEYGNWKLKVREVLKPTTFSERYIAEVQYIDNRKVSGKVILNRSLDSTLHELYVDDELMVSSVPITIKAPLNPHQFDYKKFLSISGVYHQINLNQGNNILLAENTSTLYGLAASIRNKIKSKLKNANFGEDELGIIQALFLGQRDDISEAKYNDYKKAGAVHILAVSGLHIGILLVFLEFLLMPLEMIPKGKTIKLVIIVILLWGFAILAGLSPSVVRAVTMFSFVAYAFYLNRPNITYNILALSMFFILLVFNPLLLFDVGFQMSYAAVFAIV